MQFLSVHEINSSFPEGGVTLLLMYDTKCNIPHFARWGM